MRITLSNAIYAFTKQMWCWLQWKALCNENLSVRYAMCFNQNYACISGAYGLDRNNCFPVNMSPLLLSKSSSVLLIFTVLIILSSSERNNYFWINEKGTKNVSIIFLITNTQLSVAVLQLQCVTCPVGASLSFNSSLPSSAKPVLEVLHEILISACLAPFRCPAYISGIHTS